MLSFTPDLPVRDQQGNTLDREELIYAAASMACNAAR